MSQGQETANCPLPGKHIHLHRSGAGGLARCPAALVSAVPSQDSRTRKPGAGAAASAELNIVSSS